MSDLAINPLSVSVGQTPAASAAARPQAPAQKTPKTDVIDLSKPPTAEQAERLRSFGFLGYGSISAKGTAASEKLSEGINVIHVATDYQSTYFDLVNHTTTHTSSTGNGVFSAGGSAFESTTTQFTQSWDNSSWKASVLYESGFHLNMKGLSDWYIPPRQNEDGSWSLAQYGPSAQVTVSGYHSVLAAARHSGGQTELSLSETTVYKSVFMSPSRERPAGAVDYRNERLDQMISQELLKRIGQNIKPLPLLRFDAQA